VRWFRWPEVLYLTAEHVAGTFYSLLNNVHFEAAPSRSIATACFGPFSTELASVLWLGDLRGHPPSVLPMKHVPTTGKKLAPFCLDLHSAFVPAAERHIRSKQTPKTDPAMYKPSRQL
jgi:hypothetical protein